MSQANYKDVFKFDSKFPGGAASEATNISQYSDDNGTPYNSTTINLHDVTNTLVTTTVLEDGTIVTTYTLESANGERVTLKSFSK
jgi:hypothetical protein|tara:strand:- start:540 stop:794 length:255 start_codon:yes stop_codon:yes gene_type:complete